MVHISPEIPLLKNGYCFPAAHPNLAEPIMGIFNHELCFSSNIQKQTTHASIPISYSSERACLKVRGNVGKLALLQLGLPEYWVGVIEPVLSPALLFDMI